MTGDLIGLDPTERLVLALADGVPLTKAAADCGLKSKDATIAAKHAGWPDMVRVTTFAANIRHPGDPMTREPEPDPEAPDVEDQLAAGAARIGEARASVALDSGDVQPPTRDTGTVVDFADIELNTEAAADRAPDPIDQAFYADTAHTLGIIERLGIERPLGALTPDQRARATALREVTDLILGVDPGPTTGDLIGLADWIITGRIGAAT